MTRRKQSSSYKLGNDPTCRKKHLTWHRGKNCTFTPSKINMKEKRAISRYILKGWLPETPPIPSDGRVLAMGSCFAQAMVSYLRKRKGKLKLSEGGDEVALLAYGAGFVNTFTLRQQLEWSLEDKQIKEATLFVENAEKAYGEGYHAFKLIPTTDKSKRATRRTLLSSDAFIITLGLSEVWYHKDTGEVFFGAIPNESYDQDKHGFRVSTVEENLENLSRIHQILRMRRPESTIIFSLSPVPLTATFRPVSCISADTVSKSILRVAVDELMRSTEDPKLFYWPSYEIVTRHYGLNAYKEDLRHIEQPVIDRIMSLFDQYFIQGE